MRIMEAVYKKLCRLGDQIGHSAGNFSMETWAILAIVTVVLGYFLLRGNVLRGA